MNGGDEGSGELCTAHSYSPPALEGAEDVFNDVPCPVQFMTVRSLLFPAFNRRDNGCYIRFLKHAEQFVRVIRFARRERFRFQAIHKERRMAAVRDSTALSQCRLPVSRTRQLQFAVRHPFVRLISSPAASCAACAFIYAESIIRISPTGSPTAASAGVFPIPLSRRRQNRLCTLFRFPNSGSMSLRGVPVRVFRVDEQTLAIPRHAKLTVSFQVFSFLHQPSSLHCLECRAVAEAHFKRVLPHGKSAHVYARRRVQRSAKDGE